MKSMAKIAKKEVIPQPFWFRLELRCRKLESLGLKRDRGLDLTERFDLPSTGPLEGLDPWAKVRAAWSSSGLGLSFVVESDSPTRNLNNPSFFRGVHIWIDTRDARDVHRATRYCHRFTVEVKPRGEKSIDVLCTQRPINRALAESSIAPSDRIEAIGFRLPKGYRVDLFFHADALNGFDPETNRRLGFCYMAQDPTRPAQYLGVSNEFPIAEDPSLWSILELVDD